MFGQGFFTIDQNISPEQLKKKREYLASMMPNYSGAKSVGEGLALLGTGLARGYAHKRIDKAEGKERSRISDLFSRAMGGQGGGAQAPAYSGINIAPIPADPSSPQGIANDAMVALGNAPDYAALEAQYGLPSGYLARTAQIESGGNPNAQNPNSSAGGPFQFIDSTAAQYGLTDRFDPVASADAAARLAKDNAEVLRRALGREPTAAELYLAHQQGAGGAAKLLAAGDAPAAGVVGRAAIDLNGGAGMTARDFANQWVDKFNGGQGGATVQPANMDIATWAEIANSPYADPGQRAYAQTILDQIMRQSDPMYQMGLEKSRLELDALRNPQPKDTRTDDMLEYAFASQQAAIRGQPVPTFDEWTRANRAAGAANQTVTVGGEETTPPDEGALMTSLGKKEGEVWASYLEAGATSAGTMQDMQLLDEIITMAPQGPIEGRLAGAFPGISSAADAFTSVVKRVAPTLRAPGSGATSDIEYDGMLKSLPQLSSRPEANVAISAMMKAKAQINVERANIVRAVQSGELSIKDGRKAMSELDSRSIMTPELKAILGGLAPASGGSAPEGVDQDVWDVMTPEDRALWQN